MLSPRVAWFCLLAVSFALAPLSAEDKPKDNKAEAVKIIKSYLAAPDEPARRKVLEQAAAFPPLPWSEFKAIDEEFHKLVSKPCRKGNSGKRKFLIDGKELECQFRGGGKPGKPAPMSMYLHGSGGPDSGWNGFWAIPGGVEMYPTAPPTKGDGEREWTNGHYDAFFFEIIRTMRQENVCDTNRFYLSGFSAGGFGTFYYSVRYPDLFAAVFPMAGGPWLPDMGPEYPAECNILNYRYLPVSTWHGALDKNVPVGPVRKIVAALQKLKYEVFYKEYPEGDHNNWFGSDAGFIQKECHKWIDTKVRNPFPRAVTYYAQLVISTIKLPVPGSAYWVGIVTPPVDSKEYQSNMYQAKIDGVISEGNKAAVVTAGPVRDCYVLLRKELFDLTIPVEVTWNGRSVYKQLPECRLDTLLTTFGRAWDPYQAYPVRVDLGSTPKK